MAGEDVRVSNPPSTLRCTGINRWMPLLEDPQCHAIAPWLQAGAFDIVQPDVTKVGGISEERRIAWMAQEHGVQFIPHGWNTAVGLAADLHLASAFPGTDLVEYLTGSPFIDEITAGGWKIDADGMLAIPTAPGLGLELDVDAVKKYTGGAKLLD